MKRLSLLVVFTLSILYSISIEAQDLPQVILPSPEAQAFAKYGNIPVSTYTGVPNISIPLYTVQQGDISVPINLSYHASGVKVDEEASTVGLGWVLNAGGIISRSVYGDDDFYNVISGEGGPYINDVVDDIILTSLPTFGEITPNLNPFPSQDCTVIIDGVDLKEKLSRTIGYAFEPDQFTYNVQGLSGKFALKRNGEAFLSKESKVEITSDIGPNHDNGFVIKGPNGMIYTFKKGGNRYIGGIQRGAHSWLLEKIASPTTGKEVSFSHSFLDNTIITQTAILSHTDNVDSRDPNTGNNCYSQGATTHNGGNAYNEQYLDYIDFDRGRVIFEYVAGRFDLLGARSLKSVKVYKKNSSGNITGNPIKEYQFEYEYFDSALLPASSDYKSKRLKLKKVYEVGKPGHVFSYYNEYETSKFEKKDTFQKDHWGYYNGHSSNSTLIPAYEGKNPLTSSQAIITYSGANREADPSKVSVFSLKNIQYPTGGKTEFLYESHTYNYYRSLTNNTATFRDLNKATSPDTEETVSHSHLHTPGNNGHGTLRETTFTIPSGNGNTLVEFDVYLQCSASNPTCDQLDIVDTAVYLETPDGTLYYPHLCANGANQGPDQCSVDGSFSVAPGTYTVKSSITTMGISSLQVNFQWLESTTPSEITYGGGQRIKEIRDYDGINTSPKNIKTFNYHYTDLGVEKTHGILMAEPLYEYFRRDIARGCNQFWRTSTSMVSLAGNPVGYDQVTVTTGANGELGNSIFYYRNQPNVVLGYDGYRANFPALPFNSNGLLEKQEDFNANGDKVREITNVYSPESLSTFPDSKLMGIHKNINNPSVGGNIEACFSRFYIYPAIRSNWIKLESSTETVFNLGSTTQGVTTQTDYEYGSSHKQLTKTTTTNSKGDVLISENKYAEDLNNTYLISNHMHNIPLWQQQKVDGNIVSTTETIYAQTGLPLPTTIKTSKGTGNLEPRINFHLYDDKGNPLEVSKEDGVHISYIWGYNQTYPVAKIENATRAQIDALSGFGSNFHTGFEGLSTTQENTLRISLPNTMISTYTYDPLIGVTSMTDPKGYTIYYEYDDLNRLEFVKDADGNLLSENKYNYKN